MSSYFISYAHKHGIHFMCYDGCITKKWLTKSLLDDDLVVLFISYFSKKGNKALVTYMEDGICKNKTFDFCVKGICDLDKVIETLKTDDNDLSILSFINVTNEYEG